MFESLSVAADGEKRPAEDGQSVHAADGLVCEAPQQRESTAVYQTLHYQQGVEHRQQLHPALE